MLVPVRAESPVQSPEAAMLVPPAWVRKERMSEVMKRRPSQGAGIWKKDCGEAGRRVFSGWVGRAVLVEDVGIVAVGVDVVVVGGRQRRISRAMSRYRVAQTKMGAMTIRLLLEA